MTWSIGKKDIAAVTLTAFNNTGQYYHTEIKPVITIKDGTTALKEGTDYEIVSGGSGINAGIYTLVLKGKGSYSGTIQTTWEIQARDLSRYTSKFKNNGEVVYTGKELIAEFEYIRCKDGPHYANIGEDDYILDWGTGRINVNTYTVTILPSGNGNVTGKLTAKWKITPRDINEGKIETQLRFGPGEYGTGYETWYGGHDQELLIKSVTYNGMTLQEGTDFTVTGNKATNAGDYNIIVKGKGNYNGEWTHGWKINPRQTDDITLTLNELTFNNAEQTPSIKSVLTKQYQWELLPTDYEIVATPKKDAGDAYTFQLKPSSNGNMEGNPVDFTWSIKPFDLAKARMEFKSDQVYSPLGALTANCNIYADFPGGTERLTRLDFEIVSGDTGTDVGVYTLVIKGRGNYTGTLSGNWAIVALDLAAYKIEVDTDTFTFDGQKHVPVITKVYTQSAVEIVLDPSDYQIHAAQQTDAGTYTLIIMPANNNTKNSITMIWKIDPRPISDAIFNAPDGGKIPYAGGEQELQFSLTLGSASGAAYSRAVSRAVSRAAAGDYTLRPAYDYTIVSGNKGTDVGGYKLKIDAVGKNFTGSLEIDWQIVPFDLSVAGNVRIETSTLTYSGAERVGGVNVFAVFGLREVLLSEKTEVLVLNDSNKGMEAGKYTVELEGIGNYTGKISAEWEIRQADLSVSIKDPTQVVLDASSFVYDGAKHNPTVTALYLTTMLINALPTSDYTVKVSAETDAGDYTLTIVPASKNVTGSCEVSWKITPLDISNYTLTASNSMNYRNYTITPSLKFAAPASGGILPKTKDVDYKVLSGGEGIDAGDYTVKIEGIGNFTGTLEANWSIGAARSPTVGICGWMRRAP